MSISTSRRIDSMRLGRAVAAQHAPAALFFPSFRGSAPRRGARPLMLIRRAGFRCDASSGVGLAAQRFGGANRVVERVILAALGSCPARLLVRQVCGLGAAPPALDDSATGALRGEARTARAPVMNRGAPCARHVGAPARRSRRIEAKDGCVVLGCRREGCNVLSRTRARNGRSVDAPICCNVLAPYRGRGRHAATLVNRGLHATISSAASRVARASQPERSRQ